MGFETQLENNHLIVKGIVAMTTLYSFSVTFRFFWVQNFQQKICIFKKNVWKRPWCKWVCVKQFEGALHRVVLRLNVVPSNCSTHFHSLIIPYLKSLFSAAISVFIWVHKNQTGEYLCVPKCVCEVSSWLFYHFSFTSWKSRLTNGWPAWLGAHCRLRSWERQGGTKTSPCPLTLKHTTAL